MESANPYSTKSLTINLSGEFPQVQKSLFFCTQTGVSVNIQAMLNIIVNNCQPA